MKEYKILAEKEIESVKRNFTDNTNSLKGLIEQLESFKEILVDLDIKLKDLGNDFVSKNSLSEIQIEEVKEINHKIKLRIYYDPNLF
jgi:hypothetical protein